MQIVFDPILRKLRMRDAGSGTTTDYRLLSNKPRINGITLVGNKTASALGFSTVATTGKFEDLSDAPTTISGYGITDAYIDGSKVVLGSNSITVSQQYILPKATSNSLGGIIVGANLSITSEGILSATDTTYTLATASNSGLMSAADKKKLDNLESASLSWTNIKNTPTTIRGYGITDAKIADRVITLGSNSITIPLYDTTACKPFPSSVKIDGTTLQFCNSLYQSGEDKAGCIFMGSVHITDTPPGGQADLTVKVISKPKHPLSPQDNDFDTVYLLLLNSTNTKARRWVTMFYKSRWSGATVLDGSMQYGTKDCPWFSSLMAPVDSSYDSKLKAGDPLTKKYRAATLKYVDDSIVQSDWDLTTTSAKSYIKNKPALDISGQTVTIGQKSLTVTNILDSNSNIVQQVKLGYNMAINNKLLLFVDAPFDDHFYARRNGQWVDVTSRIRSLYHIQVNINGTEAGRWRVNSDSRQYSSGLIYTTQKTGTYNISFTYVEGYTAPSPYAVLITKADALQIKLYSSSYTPVGPGPVTLKRIYYGYTQDYLTMDTSVNQLTTAVLQEAVDNNTITYRTCPDTLLQPLEIPISFVPQWSWLITLVPQGYSSQYDRGNGTWSQYLVRAPGSSETDPASGANGLKTITVNNTVYRIYGMAWTTNSQTKIRVLQP